MKKIIFFIIISITCSSVMKGQLNYYLSNMQPEQNYYDIKFGMMDYLDSLRTTMDSATFYAGDGEYKRFKIFEKIWEPKVSPHGVFSTYYDAVEDYYQNHEDDYNYYTAESWYELGPKTLQTSGSKGIGPVEFLTFYDNGTTDSTFIMLTGSTAGGLFYSTDTADTWHKTGTDAWHQSGCGSAEFHPSDYKTWFASSSGIGKSTESFWIGPTGGVFRTTNEGQTWELIGDKTDFDGEYNIIHKILLNRNNPSVLFAATNYGLYKTANCDTAAELVSWDKVLDTLVYDIEKKPNCDSIFYVSKYDVDLARWQIMVSEQYGNSGTWDTIVSQPNQLSNSNKDKQHLTIEVSKAQPDYLYCVSRDTLHRVHYIDFATSNSWTLVGSHKIGYGDGHGFGVKQTGRGEKVYTSRSLGGINYNIETGKSYLTGVVHADVEDIVCHPYDSSEVWQCTHGGVEKSVDTGVNMYARYNGLGVAQVEGFASANSNAKYVLSGLFHDGTQLTVDEYQPDWETDWKHCVGGDGMKPLINNLNPDTMWGAAQKGHWYYSTDAMQNHTYIGGITKPTYFESAGALNKVNPNIFYYNKRFNTSGFDENVGRICKDMSLEDGRISNFKPFLHQNDMALVVMLYTPDNEADYLIANVVSVDTINDTRSHHLFRTTNVDEADTSNVTWHELTIPTNNVWIADVEFDHNDPDIIYLAYSVSWVNQGIGMVYKIDYTNLQNPTTENLTKNLPVTSTSSNCLVNDRFDNGSLYLGTEYGVFFTDDNLMQQQGNEWQLFGTGLPHVDVSGLELNYPSNTLRLATFGRGHWELPIPCIHDTVPLTISSDTTWNTIMDIECDVEITSGNTLTINSQAYVRFSTESKLIIKPGGKLVVNGGTLTNKCYDLWGGIEVWGNPENIQVPAAQGWLSISNGGTVKNAVTGVRVGSEDFAGKGGGIVHTDSAFFRNNQTGVLYHDYAGSNIGNFNLTTFETTAELLDGSTPYDLMKLVNVEDITINGCTFRNTRGPTIAFNYRGKGITGIESTFYVGHICTSGTTPCTQYQETEFSKLDYGIYAIATTTTPFADIRETVFTGNKRGMYLSGMTLPRVTSNTFSLTSQQGQAIYGLYLDYCTDYWVEDNRFESGILGNVNTIGIIVNESGGDPNEIYLNEFEYVEYAINVQGENRSSTNPAQGLQIRCNEYINTKKDETIMWDEPRLNRGAGIADEQGIGTLNIEDMAGNIFHYETTTTDYDDLDNEANYFEYYYSTNASSADVEPMDAQFGVTVDKRGMGTDPWTHESACLSNINTGGGGTENERSAMNDAQEGITTTGTILAALIDGGDTETLNTEVESSTPPEAVQVYNDLMEESPNLSETVVESTIEKENVLPNPMVRDVMVANPHTAKSITLLEKLDERYDPMPEYMKAQILAGRSIQNLKQALEAQLAGYQFKKAKAMNNLARYFTEMPDTEAATDSLLDLYQQDNTLKSNYQLAWLYLKNGAYQSGSNVMSNIPSSFNLSETEQVEYNQVAAIYNMLLGLYQDDQPLDSLTVTQVNELQLMAVDGEKQPRAFARNILLALGEINYDEPILYPDHMKSTEMVEEYRELVNTSGPGMLEVYPNPAKDYVILQYKVGAEQKGQIEVKDISGMTKQVLPITGEQDQLTLITKDWTPGIYIATLTIDGNTKESIKFTLVK
jgi:hypothetical protein